MSRMQDKFDADLRAAFEVAGEYRDKIEHIKAEARKAPKEYAIMFCEFIGETMEECRAEAEANWHLDISSPEWLENPSLDLPDSLPERVSLLDRVNLYLASQWLQQRFLRTIREHADDPTLLAHDLAEKVCGIGIEALEIVGESAKLHGLRQVHFEVKRQGGADERTVRFVGDVADKQLAGALATRISLRKNRRLARALDELREYDEPASRERFKVLLRELYVEAPTIWERRHNTDLRLHATRSAVAKKIAQRSSSPPLAVEEIEQSTFAEREAVLRRGRDAGLPPREYELLKLLVEESEISSREAGERLGLSPGAVRALKARINKTLGAA